MYFDEFKHQLPDIDPQETDEWLASLDDVVGEEGENRARFLMFKLLKRARQLHVGLPPLTQTRYINTISPEQEPFFPGDEQLELRIRRIIRWNAVAMVLRSNNQFPGIGGHLSTYASSASLYEVGFNHFFLGKDAEGGGDQVYYQGHAAPGMYARAFLEGRLSEEQLDHFRREVSGKGLSSYPHPRLMPEFWEFPTVSMGLGPLAAIYQARFNRYLQNRGMKDTSGQRVWAFLGDGEMDEPEALAGLSLAAREGLDNLTFVVNCNLQRLDGPVRGNGKIIQELEADFRGSGWNVLKVIWGRYWDPLLARDHATLQAQHWHVSCLDTRTRRRLTGMFSDEELPRHCYYGDGTPIEDSVMSEILDVYARLEVCFPWRAGDVLLVDNVLAAHARNVYEGERKMLVAMGDMMSYTALRPRPEAGE